MYGLKPVPFTSSRRGERFTLPPSALPDCGCYFFLLVFLAAFFVVFFFAAFLVAIELFSLSM
jgi:hypothetical protein